MNATPPNRFRVVDGVFATDISAGMNGAFFAPFVGRMLKCIVSDGGGWEHVSVSLKNRCPTWEEMCFVKNLFWREDECVIQFHPPKADYVNNHPFCLHLWKPTEVEIPTPPSIMVSLK